MPATWSTPVRYAEVDQQGIVFNAHYLTWCDEAFAAFTTARGLADLADRSRVKTATLTWTGPARVRETVEVDVRCERLGRTSATFTFDLRCGGRECCRVETVYVLTDEDGVPQPFSDAERAALT
jgi:acyl-CoA thioester hydrolase